MGTRTLGRTPTPRPPPLTPQSVCVRNSGVDPRCSNTYSVLMPTATTRRAIAYVRLSQADDESTSIRRQEEDLQALAEAEGWDVVRVLVDEGISGGIDRANAAEALRMLRDDEADVLMVWKLDRWSRQGLGALADLIRVLDSRPGALFVAMKDGLRSSQDSWRIIASVLSEVARMERDAMRTRQISSQRYLRENGRWRGGRPPYGYEIADNPDGPGKVLVVNNAEAEIVREVARRLLNREPLLTITRELNERGVPTRTGKQWRTPTWRTILTGTAVLGRTAVSESADPADSRARGASRVLRTEDGLPAQHWPAVLDMDSWEALRDLFDTNRRGPHAHIAPHVLAGIVYCSACARRMVLSSQMSHGTRRRFFRCPSRPEGLPCSGGYSINADRAADVVVSRYLAAFGAHPEMKQTITRSTTDLELVDVERAIRETTTAMAETDSDDRVNALLGNLAHLRAERRRLRSTPPTTTVDWAPTGRAIAEAWEAASTEVRREMLAATYPKVLIGPTIPGRVDFNARIRIPFTTPTRVAASNDTTPQAPGVTVVVPTDEYAEAALWNDAHEIE